MATYFLDGPDELAKLEFMSRQKLLMEDKIMKNKINNYVQLVNALTGQEVFMPANDDEYSFVSVSSEENVEEDEEEVIDEEIEYVEVEEVSVDPESDFLLESVRTQESGNREELRIENIHELEGIPEAPPPVDNAPPPTPSQIIRKLKATLVQTTMCQIRNTKRKSVKRLGDNNWSYDMARRRLDRELKRIQKRRAYRDAVERMPELTESMQAGEQSADANPESSSLPAAATTTLTEQLAEKDAQVVRDAAAKRPSPLERQLSRKGSLSGSVFAGLLKTLEVNKRPSDSGGTPRSRNSGTSGPKSRRHYRSDERLQAILKKHQTNLKEEKAKIHSSSQAELPPPPPADKK